MLLASLCGAVLASQTVRSEPASACATAVLTLPEAAQLLRVEDEALRQLAEHAEIPARRVGAVWRFNCAALMSWLEGDGISVAAPGMTARIDAPAAAEAVPERPLTAGELGAVVAAGTSSVSQVQPQSPPARRESSALADDVEPIGQAPSERTAEDVLLRDQRVLLDRRQAVLDFGQFYAESNGQLLVASNEGAALATVEQETLFTTIQARIGLSSDSELFVGTTYFARQSDAFISSQKIGLGRTSDFGGINLGLRKTLVNESTGRPDIIGTLTTNIPTGDTSYALGGGLSFVKSFDPAILFASVNYSHTFSRDFADVTLLEPEDRVDISFGYALALNDTLALSMAVSSAFTGATRFDNASLRQQDRHSLRFGLTSWLASGIYIEPSVTFNLGGPEDRFIFGLTVPYSLGRRTLRD